MRVQWSDWSGHRLGLPWYWVVCLGNEQRSFFQFWDCIQVLHFRVFFFFFFFFYCDGYSISSKGFLPRVVDMMSSELNSPIPVHFSSLIPKMSSLIWLLSIFLIHGPNIPGPYAILLITASDLASITSDIHNWVLFCFGSVFSFFLELLLYWSPVAYGHLLTCGVHLSVSYLFTFSYCSWGSQGKNTEVVCHSLLQWTTFCQNSPPSPVCLGWPYMAWLIVSLS